MKLLSRFKLKKLSRKQKIIGLVLSAVIVGGIAYVLTRPKTEPAPAAPPEPTYSLLTGVEVPSEIAARPILGIMVENSAEARPQTGLDSAGIVFETTTEGGITRFLALYQEDQPEIVGPVRSVRPYFVDWAMGFDASLAHVGGSAPALRMIEDRHAKSLNQFKYPEPYYRGNDRPAPHNMYVRTEGLRDLQVELEHSAADFTPLPRKADAPLATPTANKVTVGFSSPTFLAEFIYDKATNSYDRRLAGQAHIDEATNKPINVKNVVVIRMPRSQASAVGSNEAFIFMDGKVIEASWEIDNFNQRLRIIDASGNEIALNRGQTWIAAVPPGRDVTY